MCANIWKGSPLDSLKCQCASFQMHSFNGKDTLIIQHPSLLKFDFLFHLHRCLENGHYDLYQCQGSQCFCTDCAGLKIEGYENFGRHEVDSSKCKCARERVRLLHANRSFMLLRLANFLFDHTRQIVYFAALWMLQIHEIEWLPKWPGALRERVSKRTVKQVGKYSKSCSFTLECVPIFKFLHCNHFHFSFASCFIIC